MDRRQWTLWALAAILVWTPSCTPETSETEITQAAEPSLSSPEDSDAKIDLDRPVVLAFGDSLTAGHMVDRNLSYPSQLQARLDELGFSYRVVNQGISGDTTSGGLARLERALALKPEVVILELGANDGLRGIPIEVARQNLSAMITAFKSAGTRVVLAGLTLPRNYGPTYIHDFETMYVELAEQYQVERIPFFLEGVAGNRELNLADGIHPTAEGYTIVAANVLEAILPYLHK